MILFALGNLKCILLIINVLPHVVIDLVEFKRRRLKSALSFAKEAVNDCDDVGLDLFTLDSTLTFDEAAAAASEDDVTCSRFLH